ncbi:MAG: hypothetical protein K1X72_26260 [Pyrinomonadaceae bacterium]|nr:hypothetical protein [Pyrinomonadaceae bacterium]
MKRSGFLLFFLIILTLCVQSQTIVSSAESSEVNQLVNIVISLTPYANEKNLVLSPNSEFNQKARDWFDKYKDYRVVRDFNDLLKKDDSAFQELKKYSAGYKFKGKKLVRNNDKNLGSSRFGQFIPQLEVFAISSDFRKFYRKNYHFFSAIQTQSQNSNKKKQYIRQFAN